MILKELFQERREVITLTREARISAAAELMRRESIGSIVIVQDKQVVGLITDRDIALGVALGVATPDSFVTEIMSQDVKTVKETMPLYDVARQFRSTRVKRLPVVNSQNQLVGIVSVDDVLALLARELFDTCSTFEPKLGHMV